MCGLLVSFHLFETRNGALTKPSLTPILIAINSWQPFFFRLLGIYRCRYQSQRLILTQGDPWRHCIDEHVVYSYTVLTTHSMVNRMSELQIASSSDSPEVAINAKVALDLEKKLSEQLVALKADVLSTQSLQTQLAELREAKATSDDRCGAKDGQINDLNEQLGRLQEAKNTLVEKLNKVEAQLCEHTSCPSGEEFESVKQELEEVKRKLETADETETTLRTELETLQESVQAKEGLINSVTMQKLESERKVSQVSFWL